MGNETPFQVEAEIVDVKTKRNRSQIIKLETQENLSDMALGRIGGFVGKLGWFTFNLTQIKAEHLSTLPELQWEKIGKKASVRMREALFVLATSRGVKKEDFEQWYETQMNRMIENIKNQIP